MREKLEELLENAYAPYSNFKVAAIAEMKDGKTFLGVNVENASFGAGVCAERIAIFDAIKKGYRKGDFAKIHLMLSSKKEGYPCFLCRQVMSEFFDGTEILIVYTEDGTKSMNVESLMPYPFTKEDLKWNQDL